MITQLLAISKNAFVESVRQPILVVLVLLSGVLQVFNTWNAAYSMADTESSQVSGDTKLLFDIGLGTIFVIATLLAGFIATAVISREIENKTVLTVVSKPIGRPTLILGKYLGVAGAIMASVLIMLVFLMLALRHGVMSTRADQLDGPVIFFGIGSVFLAILLSGWCNFFYGWNFPQTVMAFLVPFTLIAYLLVLFFDPRWRPQPLDHDFKGQIAIASACLALAVLVLTSVALAASTRLGQVMTILVCLGVFLAALLSNYVLGRHVFSNTIVGEVRDVALDNERGDLELRAGDYLRISLTRPPQRLVEIGNPLYISPSPNGFPMLNMNDYGRFRGDITDLNAVASSAVPPGLAVAEVQGTTLRVRRVGPGGPDSLRMVRMPEKGDFAFQEPTRINTPALVAWGVVPNLQFFWLLDAVSQNRPVPRSYLGLVSLYALCQIGVFLSLSVILFQRRDVG
ncbi:MAG: hypothetical protein HBSAPP03_26110 [Phycisphaerae bacterium]|nr:MAG: hypothetical protein HBSAPP03_26110 [Phycisphaerae bacterium]